MNDDSRYRSTQVMLMQAVLMPQLGRRLSGIQRQESRLKTETRDLLVALLATSGGKVCERRTDRLAHRDPPPVEDLSINSMSSLRQSVTLTRRLVVNSFT